MRQLSLFPPPEPPSLTGSLILDFNLVLKDGTAVSVHYMRRYFQNSSHFEFRGDISSTGYQSLFPNGERFMKESDEEIIEVARTLAEMFREERLTKIAKEARQRKRKRT